MPLMRHFPSESGRLTLKPLVSEKFSRSQKVSIKEIFNTQRDSEGSLFIWTDHPQKQRTFLKAEDYPVLAAIWDNEHDAVYDSL